MRRRDALLCLTGASAFAADDPGFRLVDVTAQAGIRFVHNTGGFGKKYLPETMGPGCAFLDYDGDGWQDILIVNGTDFSPGSRRRTPLALYRNNRNGTFQDVTRQAGLDVPMYGLGVAVGDYDNDGFPDIFISCVGQSRLFRNTGRGTFIDATKQAGLLGREAFSTSALWLDYDRDGLLDLFVCNYVRWSPETDVFCPGEGGRKSYCTPEAYRGATCWLFRNVGGGRFEDVTAKAGIFDSSSKALGATLLDYENDGWPDLFVANDTQPNRLFRNLRNGRFQEIGIKAGVAFSEDGKARAGMGVDAADLDGSGVESLVVTNFQNEMLGLFKPSGKGAFTDVAPGSELGRVTRRSLGFGCFFFDPDLDGSLDLLVANGHIDAGRNIEHAQPPHLFLNRRGSFRDVAAGEFAKPKIGRGAAYGDIDNDGDQDVLIATNGGPAYLYRNDVTSGNRSLRLRLIGTASNRDGIGATVRIEAGDLKSARTVKSGSSYLSQSELPLTFGLGRRSAADLVVIRWPNGRTEEYRNLKAGRYECTEGKGIRAL
jgi:enediyne biosynthesis protein E4